jgi:hypothetical protein
MNLMAQNLILLQAWNNVADIAKLKNSGVYDTIKAGSYETDGLYFMGKLNYYIQEGMNDKEGSVEKGVRTAKYLYAYSQVALIRGKMLFLLSVLYGTFEDDVLVQSSVKLQQAHKKRNAELHGPYSVLKSIRMPDDRTTNYVYDGIHALEVKERRELEAYLKDIGNEILGDVVRLKVKGKDYAPHF